MRRRLLDPRYAAFPVFWFPILVPIALAVLGIVGDLVSSRGPTTGASPASQSLSANVLIYLVFKNLQLSYVSTDIWALTTFIQAGATGKLEGTRTWVYTLATVIGLLFHMLAYLILAVAAAWHLAFVLGLCVAALGTLGVLLIRAVVFEHLEFPALAQIGG